MKFKKVIVRDNGDEFPYNEEISDEGYFYQISISWDDKEAIVSILNEGCDIEFEDGRVIDTNITPQGLFPNKVRLDESDLLKILDTIADSDLEGKEYSKEEMENIYEQYLEETGNEDLRNEEEDEF